MNCPYCKSTNNWRYGSITRKILDRILGEFIEVTIKLKRYSCRACGRTYTVPPKGIDKSSQYGPGLLQYIKHQTAYRTHESVADELGLATSTVAKYATKRLAKGENHD